ncbi:MAG: hypothetical protein GF353_14525 [Candidatus Lokiarchaeota archaeon]|nr:hypothetical protein [Candidatus Lokiarchaeota archaeon]
MKLEKILYILKILEFILSNPLCSAPEVRDFLGITHKKNLSKKEKRFYAILTKLENEGYISKIPIEKKGSGGAQFKIKISEKGIDFFSKLKAANILEKNSLENIQEKYLLVPKGDDKPSNLEKILKVFSSEIFDIVLEEIVEKIMRDVIEIRFENIEFDKQQQIIDIINDSVRKISNRTFEIVNIFFDNR